MRKIPRFLFSSWRKTKKSWKILPGEANTERQRSEAEKSFNESKIDNFQPSHPSIELKYEVLMRKKERKTIRRLSHRAWGLARGVGKSGNIDKSSQAKCIYTQINRLKLWGSTESRFWSDVKPAKLSHYLSISPSRRGGGGNKSAPMKVSDSKKVLATSIPARILSGATLDDEWVAPGVEEWRSNLFIIINCSVE